MIAVDTNILVYAGRREMPKHPAALRRLKGLAEGPEPWALPVFCLGELVRVVTHPRVFDPPTPLREALDGLESLLKSPSVRLLLPGTAYPALFAEACVAADARGNLAFDAQIAALLAEHALREILSEDRDFSRFPGLKVVSL